MKLGEAMYASQQGGEAAAEPKADDVVDADFEEVQDDDRKKSA